MAIPRSWRSKMRRPARCTRSRSTDRRRATGWRYSTATQASCRPTPMKTTTRVTPRTDRKSTRLNSSHGYISYAVFCLKKKKKMEMQVCCAHASYLQPHQQLVCHVTVRVLDFAGAWNPAGPNELRPQTLMHLGEPARP